MQGYSCIPRGNGSTGTALMQKQVAQAHTCDYDHIRGNDHLQIFFPITAARLFANVPLYFPKDSRLIGKKLTSLELVDGAQVLAFNGVDMPTNFKNGWIVLRDDCGDLLAEMPLSRLNRALNGNKNLFFKNMPVDWSKSYLLVTDTTGLSSAGFLFNVWTD